MMHTIADIAIILGQSPELSLVVKMTLAAALGLAVVRFARAARASVRHLVLTSTFAALLALPVAMLIVPVIAIELPWASIAANASSAAQAATAAAESETDPAGAAAHANGSNALLRTGGNSVGQDARAAGAEGQSRSGFVIWLTAVGRATGLLSDTNNATTSTSGSWFARAPWLAMMRVIWLAGAALMLAMFAIALVKLRAVRRTALPWLERRDDVVRVAREVGVNRLVDVTLHERISAPITCGWRNPVIVFPADAREWSDGDVRRVLLHELEHVKRGDWIVQLAARTICAIYWFHPLVWTAWRQLCLEAERACDDAVVRSEAETDYAEQLVQLARRMSVAPAQPMVAMANRSDLSARVTALLDQRQRRGRAGITTFVAAASAAAFIVITIGPLRAVAASDDQVVIADGRGTGSGSGSGSGSGIGRGPGKGVGRGDSKGSGIGAGSNPGDVIDGGPGGGVIGSIPGGVVGGEPGGVVGGAPGGVVGGVPGGVVGGRPGSVIANVDGTQSVQVAESLSERVSGGVVVDGQVAVDDKRRVSRADRALGEALIGAAGDGDIRALEELLAAGLNVNTRVNGDGSALIAAAKKGQIAAMKFLIERGADVNMGVEGDGNPLIAAAARGQTAAVTLLLERGATIEAVVDGDENALIQAAGNGHLEVVKLLVARGANVNARVTVESNVDGQPKTEDRTPLGMARRGGHAAVVAFLQSAGAVE